MAKYVFFSILYKYEKSLSHLFENLKIPFFQIIKKIRIPFLH